MAWPKGRRRTKSESPAQDIGFVDAPVLGHPAQPEATSSAGHSVEDAAGIEQKSMAEALKAIRRTIMLHRLMGPKSTLDWAEWRRIRHYEDMRDQKLVWHIQAAMAKDGASIDEAEAYLDAELARR